MCDCVGGHAIQVFVLCEQDAVKLRILPNDGAVNGARKSLDVSSVPQTADAVSADR